MKIYIFGSTGSGKTTIAKKISAQLHISHFDLDEIFWNFEKGKKNNLKRKKEVLKIISRKSWIIEGMYKDKWLKGIISSSDVIFILRPLKIITYLRIFKRTILRILRIEKYERKSDFRLLFNLLETAKNFEQERLPEFLSQVRTLKKKVVFIKNKKQLLQKLVH